MNKKILYKQIKEFALSASTLLAAILLWKGGKQILSLPLFVLAMSFLVCSTIVLCFMVNKPLTKLIEQIIKE